MTNLNLNQELTILIVLYKESLDLIEKNLDNLTAFKKILIDNASDYEIKKKLESKYLISNYILNKKNVGYSKAYNQAINLCSTKYALMLSADCVMSGESIIKLLDSHKKYINCFITSPTSYDYNENLTYNGGLLPENCAFQSPLNVSGDVCVQSVLGAAMLFKTNDVKDIGLLDENFFLYYSDNDLCRRIIKKQKSIIQIFSSKCYHSHGNIKVKSAIQKIFIRENNITYDGLYYYYKIGVFNKDLIKIKKKILNYLFKFIINFIILRINKSILYLGKFIGCLRFLFFIIYNKKNEI
jgi:N-acetylglucosaminyl-diphospho-decaprenol L-rhamnosyltransferase